MDEYNFCREPFKMFYTGSGDTWTTAVAGDDTANPSRWPYRITKPGEGEWDIAGVDPYDVDYVVGFIEVFGTYTDGECTGGCGSCTDESELIPFYFTGLPSTPEDSNRVIDYQTFKAAGFDQDSTSGKWWFRPRVRSVGGIGPGSGDTCCTWPGEIVKISPEEDVDLVAMPGDFIGDSCNEANLSGTINEAKLKRLRYHSWVGTTFGDDDTPLDEIFLWRRAPQYADNNRDGIGNYCEDDWDYTSHGVWDADPGSGEWDRESINSNGGGGDFIAPDGHGVPDSLPAMTTPPPTCGSFQADPRDAGLNGALMLFVVLPTLFAWRSRHRS